MSDYELSVEIRRRLAAAHPEDICEDCGNCERNACEIHQLCYCGSAPQMSCHPNHERDTEGKCAFGCDD